MTALDRPSARTIDTAIAIAAFGISVVLLGVGDLNGDPGEITALGIALAAASTLPLVAVRSHALEVFVVSALASIALRAFEAPVGPPIGPTIALFWVGATGSRQHVRLTLALVAAMLAGHVLAPGLGTDTLTGALFGIVVWGGAWFVGDRTRLRSERMAELEERAQRAEREAERERALAAAEERTRIARDLHDSAGHAINVILVHAGLGRLRTGDDPDAARAAFETIEEVARDTVGDIDRMVHALREDEPEGVEPPPGLAAVDALFQRHREAGLDVTATVSGEREAVSASVDRAAYRILQEALTNAARHGDGNADVSVAVGADALDLRIANEVGRNGASPGGGHGIVGMRERAAVLGGNLEAGRNGGRFTVHATLPLAP